MLLQTFIQLHILLAATPGLAGWTLFVPASQPLPAHIIYLAARHPILTGELKQMASQRASSANVTQGFTSCSPFASSAMQVSGLCIFVHPPLPYGLSGGASFSTHSPRAP